MFEWPSACALLAAAMLSLAAAGAHAETTLNDALERARRENSEIQAALADVAIAEGERTAAGEPAHNPEVALSAGPVLGVGSGLYDVEVSLAQTIELGGKRSRRRAGATERLAAARARLAFAQWQNEVRVRHAYTLAQVARVRVARAGEAEAIAAEVRTAVQDRLRLGAGTQLEVNVALSDQGRLRRDRLDAERRLEAAQAELSAAVGAHPGELLEPTGEPILFAPLSTTEAEFVARAVQRRADLAAAEADVRAASAEVDLTRAQAIPDLTVSLSYAREGEPDTSRNTLLVGVAVPVPILTRYRGQRQAAAARLRRARVVVNAGRIEVERQARTAYRNFARARDAILGFDDAVIARLADNLELARQSFVAGKIGTLELTVLRRDLVATGFAYLDSLAEAADAWRDAALAAGGPEVTP